MISIVAAGVASVMSDVRKSQALSVHWRRVVDAVNRVYRGNRDVIDAFLSRPHPLLEGETPFDMARSGSAGAEAVLNLIRRAEAGISP